MIYIIVRFAKKRHLKSCERAKILTGHYWYLGLYKVNFFKIQLLLSLKNINQILRKLPNNKTSKIFPNNSLTYLKSGENFAFI